MRLVLGKIGKSYNSVNDIPIALHCLIGCEKEHEKLADLTFPDLTKLNSQLPFIDEVTAKESLWLTQEIAKKYNFDIYEMHSERFWQFIYYPLVALIVQSVYARQLYFENFISENKQVEKLQVELESDKFVWVCKDDNAVIDLLRSADFSAWMYSRFFEKKSTPEFHCLPKIQNVSTINSSVILEEDVYSRKFKLINKFRIKHIYGFSFFDVIIFNFLTLLRKKKRIERKKSSQNKLKSEITWLINIEDLIEKLLPEKYKNLAITKKISPPRLFDFSNLLFYYYDAKIEAALAYDNGDTILTNQHGGHNYGSALTFEFNRHIEYDVDYHITWGNTSYVNKTNAIFLRLPSPLLSKYLNTYRHVNQNIICVGTAMFATPFRLESFFWTIAHKYRKLKEHFLKELVNSQFEEYLQYRPYGGAKNCCLSDEEYFKSAIPALEIMKGDFHKEISKCALLILDHPGTTWNIAIAMNTPFLLIWEKPWFPFNQEADMYLERFREIGIFFDNPSLMIQQLEFVKSKYGTFAKWWSSHDIQKLRAEWMSKYALADKNWRKQWLQVYRNI
ncbi:MAG: hypothetical protein MH132_10160 [Hydrotalea sp.]|nr:hypothetical protein [Hydrotalea sp.]